MLRKTVRYLLAVTCLLLLLWAVNLNAQPVIVIDVSSFELVLTPGVPHEETFNITNLGTQTLSYEMNFTYVGEEPHVLVVDDDGSLNNGGTYPEMQRFYTDALDSAGFAYEFYVVDWSITPQQPGPSAEIMSEYDLVIWFTGETWGYTGNDTITGTDELNLGIFLDGGGSLFLSSQDYFYDVYTSAGSFYPGQFPYDYLGVTSTEQDVWTIPYSCAGGPHSFAHDMSFACQYPYPTSAIWTDEVFGPGEPLLLIQSQPVAIQYEPGTFKSAFTALSFETLVDGDFTKAQFMENLIDWVGVHTSQALRTAPTPSPIPETDDPWLVLNPAVGSVEPQESQLVTVTFQMPDTAVVGDYYEGTIIVENNSPSNPITIPVMVYMEESGISRSNPHLPTSFALFQNYPNPFNAITNIKFDLPVASFTKLTIYNILGEKVATLIDRPMQAGSYQVTYDTDFLPSGTYMVKMRAGEYELARVVTLIK